MGRSGNFFWLYLESRLGSSKHPGVKRYTTGFISNSVLIHEHLLSNLLKLLTSSDAVGDRISYFYILTQSADPVRLLGNVRQKT